MLLLLIVTLMVVAGSVAALSRFAARDSHDRAQVHAAALLAGDLEGVRRVAGPSERPEADLVALAAVTNRACAARGVAVAAMARRDWAAATEALGPTVRALPGDADARGLLVAAREHRLADWKADEQRAARDGDRLARELALAAISAADPDNPMIE